MVILKVGLLTSETLSRDLLGAVEEMRVEEKVAFDRVTDRASFANLLSPEYIDTFDIIDKFNIFDVVDTFDFFGQFMYTRLVRVFIGIPVYVCRQKK